MNSFKQNSYFRYYMYFIGERMKIFWNKQNGVTPYTHDEILSTFKFTNVYRVLDRSSQYLLRNVIYNGKFYNKETMTWRILMYKHFNLPSTWEALCEEFGDVTLDISSDEIVKFLKRYSKDNVVYSNAYMITAAFMQSEKTKLEYGLVTGMPKFELYIKLFDICLFEDDIITDVMNSRNIEECFNHLKRIVGVADFLAYQFVQDLNYTDYYHFDDNEFCAAGPGTQRGIERCFDTVGKPDYQEIIKWVHSNFEQLLEDYNIQFTGIPGWTPKVPDLSNCFCETSKYLKGISPGDKSGDKRIKNSFTETLSKIEFMFPTKWGVKI